MRILPFLWLWLVSGLASAQDIFEYDLPQLGATKKECEQKLTTISGDLARLAGVDIIGIGCEPHSVFQDHYNGRIGYRAAEAIKTFKSQNQGNILELEGLYTSRAECLGDLARVTQLFTESSSLTPFATWCYREPSSAREVYAFSLHALGETTTKRMIVGAILDGLPCCDQNEVLTRLEERIKTRHPELALIDVSFYSHMLLQRFRLEYFGDKAHYLQVERQVQAENQEQCLQLAERLDQDLQDQILGSFCIKDQIIGNPYQANILSFKRGVNTDGYRLQRVPGSFGDRASCEQALEAVLDGLTTPALSAVCSYRKNGEFEMLLFR